MLTELTGELQLWPGIFAQVSPLRASTLVPGTSYVLNLFLITSDTVHVATALERRLRDCLEDQHITQEPGGLSQPSPLTPTRLRPQISAYKVPLQRALPSSTITLQGPPFPILYLAVFAAFL